MRIVRIVAAATGLIVATASVGIIVPLASANARVAPTPTQQWSGYAITSPSGNSSGFTHVTASWKQPKVTCRTGAGSSAFWVGLGGFSSDSNKIEQIGAASDCTSANKPKYYAWYDLPPNAGVILSLEVRPADVMTASVHMNATRTQVSLRIVNTTTGGAYSTKLPVFSPDVTSAEWITEAPSECDQSGFCQSTPLADFGQISFTRISAGTTSHDGSITDPRWQRTAIELVPGTHTNRYFPEAAGAKASSSRAGAIPNGLTAAGDAFGVKWKANIAGSQPAPAPASPGTYVAEPRRP